MYNKVPKSQGPANEKACNRFSLQSSVMKVLHPKDKLGRKQVVLSHKNLGLKKGRRGGGVLMSFVSQNPSM